MFYRSRQSYSASEALGRALWGVHDQREGATYSNRPFPSWDEVKMPKASLTEIVSSPATGPGGSLVLYTLPPTPALRKGETGDSGRWQECLCSAGDFLKPNWIDCSGTRCREAQEALKVADLAVRDGKPATGHFYF